MKELSAVMSLHTPRRAGTIEVHQRTSEGDRGVLSLGLFRRTAPWSVVRAITGFGGRGESSGDRLKNPSLPASAGSTPVSARPKCPSNSFALASATRVLHPRLSGAVSIASLFQAPVDPQDAARAALRQMQIRDRVRELRRVKAGTLVPNPRNWRKHPKAQADALRGILSEIGYADALLARELADGSLQLIDGHLRAETTPDADIPVLVVDVSEEEADKLLASLDPLASLAVADVAKLESLLSTLHTDSPSLSEVWSNLAKENGIAVEQMIVEDSIPEPPKVAITQPGDLWILGSHRLLCGSCTDTACVKRLMNGERAILFVTDPPYLVGYDGTNHPQSFTGGGNKDWSGSYGTTWDDADANSDLYEKFIRAAIDHALDERAAWYCWYASKRHVMLENAWVAAGVLPHCQIIWAKNRPVLTRTWYMWQHEPCLMGWLKGMKPSKVSDETLSTVWNLDTIPNGEERPDHPTPKPLECFEIPMRQHTKAGDLCYEPFSGSGTQIIAAQHLGRRCFAMEIEPRYVDVAVQRWEKLTGLKAVRNPAGAASGTVPAVPVAVGDKKKPSPARSRRRKTPARAEVRGEAPC